MTAAISIGLPWRSFTLSRSESKFRIRVDTLILVKKMFAQWRPGFRTVPT